MTKWKIEGTYEGPSAPSLPDGVTAIRLPGQLPFKAGSALNGSSHVLTAAAVDDGQVRVDVHGSGNGGCIFLSREDVADLAAALRGGDSETCVAAPHPVPARTPEGQVWHDADGDQVELDAPGSEPGASLLVRTDKTCGTFLTAGQWAEFRAHGDAIVAWVQVHA